MRTLMTFLACSGFIVWAHSCDTRILGVQPKAVIQESLVAKRSLAAEKAANFRQQYVKQFVAATAFTKVGHDLRLYMASFSAKKDSMFMRLHPQFDAHN